MTKVDDIQVDTPSYVMGFYDGVEAAFAEALGMWVKAQPQGQHEAVDTEWFGQKLRTMLTNAKELVAVVEEKVAELDG